jgi:hypothetical protein
MMRILSFDRSRLRGRPSAGRKQMLDQELRQPRFIAFGLPALFHDQHAIDIKAGQRPQHVSRFLKRQTRMERPLFAQGSNQPGLVPYKEYTLFDRINTSQ